MRPAIERIVTRCGDCPFTGWVGTMSHGYQRCCIDGARLDSLKTLPVHCPLREAPIRVSLPDDEPEHDRPLELD